VIDWDFQSQSSRNGRSFVTNGQNPYQLFACANKCGGDFKKRLHARARDEHKFLGVFRDLFDPIMIISRKQSIN
jgi:hypothetical protein